MWLYSTSLSLKVACEKLALPIPIFFTMTADISVNDRRNILHSFSKEIQCNFFKN
jgi:hypothetical protein